MQSSPWDRGRLKTTHCTSLRMAFAMHVLATEIQVPRLREELAQAVEDNDVLIVATIQAQQTDTQNVQIVMAAALGRHLSAMGSGPIALSGPALQCATEITTGQFYELTGFDLKDFVGCVELHTKLPPIFRSTISRHKCTKECGLLLAI